MYLVRERKLYFSKDGKLKEKYCPLVRGNITCGEWCALFEETETKIKLNCCRVFYSKKL